MKKAFEFDDEAEEVDNEAPHEITIHGQTFKLRTDVDGMDILNAVANTSGGPGSTRAIYEFLIRTIRPEDMERFRKATARFKPRHFGQVAGGIIDLYSGFPTTPDESSSSGD